MNVESAEMGCVVCVRDDSVVHAATTTALTAGHALARLLAQVGGRPF